MWDARCGMRVAGCELRDASGMRDARCEMRDAGCEMRDMATLDPSVAKKKSRSRSRQDFGRSPKSP